MSLPNRLAALEAALNVGETRVLFVSWVRPSDAPHRLVATVGGAVVARQEAGEDEGDFLSRAEWALLQADGLRGGLRVAFLHSIAVLG